MGSINFSSILSFKDLKAKVQVDFEGRTAIFTADEAENMARQIVQVSEAARTDEFLMNFVSDFMGLDKERGEKFAMILIDQFRKYRETPIGKAKCPTCSSANMEVLKEGDKFVARCADCKGIFK
jgi:hypothetical protein